SPSIEEQALGGTRVRLVCRPLSRLSAPDARPERHCPPPPQQVCASWLPSASRRRERQGDSDVTFSLGPPWALCLAATFLTLAGSELGRPVDAFGTMGHEEPKIVQSSPAADRAASSNPLSGDAEAIGEGHGLFVKFCAPCHGRHA